MIRCNVFSYILYETFSLNKIKNIATKQIVKISSDMLDFSMQQPLYTKSSNEIKRIIKKLPKKKGHRK
jgi:hypothetical protein